MKVANLEVAVRRVRSTAGRYCSAVDSVHSEYLQDMFDSQIPLGKTSWVHLRARRPATAIMTALRPLRRGCRRARRLVSVTGLLAAALGRLPAWAGLCPASQTQEDARCRALKTSGRLPKRPAQSSAEDEQEQGLAVQNSGHHGGRAHNASARDAASPCCVLWAVSCEL